MLKWSVLIIFFNDINYPKIVRNLFRVGTKLVFYMCLVLSNSDRPFTNTCCSTTPSEMSNGERMVLCRIQNHRIANGLVAAAIEAIRWSLLYSVGGVTARNERRWCWRCRLARLILQRYITEAAIRIRSVAGAIAVLCVRKRNAHIVRRCVQVWG